jgi:hypothetical protein
LDRNRRRGRLPQRIGPGSLQSRCRCVCGGGRGQVRGEVCLQRQAGGRRADMVVEVRVTAGERGEQRIRGRRGSIRMRSRRGPVGGNRRWGSSGRCVAGCVVQVGQPVAVRRSGGREIRSGRLGALHGVVGQAAGEPACRVPVTGRPRVLSRLGRSEASALTPPNTRVGVGSAECPSSLASANGIV